MTRRGTKGKNHGKQKDPVKRKENRERNTANRTEEQKGIVPALRRNPDDEDAQDLLAKYNKNYPRHTVKFGDDEEGPGGCIKLPPKKKPRLGRAPVDASSEAGAPVAPERPFEEVMMQALPHDERSPVPRSRRSSIDSNVWADPEEEGGPSRLWSQRYPEAREARPSPAGGAPVAASSEAEAPGDGEDEDEDRYRNMDEWLVHGASEADSDPEGYSDYDGPEQGKVVQCHGPCRRWLPRGGKDSWGDGKGKNKQPRMFAISALKPGGTVWCKSCTAWVRDTNGDVPCPFAKPESPEELREYYEAYQSGDYEKFS